MIISDATWTVKYIGRLRKINDAAADKMRKYLEKHSIVTLQDWNALIDYAYGVSSKYGEAAAAIACEFYDAMAEATKVTLPAAEAAATATYSEVAKAVRGTGKSGNVELMAGAVSRLVKMAGVDTTMQNAIRDRAEWAWIPRGDTCAFCVTLASRGWQKASRKAIYNGHAEHIHANCDCTYAVRFDSSTDVEGYDDGKPFLELYKNSEGQKPEDKINDLRSALYHSNPNAIKRRSEYNKTYFAEHKEEIMAKRQAKKKAKSDAE